MNTETKLIKNKLGLLKISGRIRKCITSMQVFRLQPWHILSLQRAFRGRRRDGFSGNQP